MNTTANTTANSTAGRTRIAARLIVGTAAAALAFGLGSMATAGTAAAGPVGPTDVVACPTQGMAAGLPTLIGTPKPVTPSTVTLIPQPPQTTNPKPAVELPDPTIVLPPPVGDPEPTFPTFTAAPKPSADCGYDPEPTDPTDTEEPTDTPDPVDPSDGSDTPAADTDDLAYTGVSAGVMTVGGLVLLGGGALVLLVVRQLSRRVG